MTVNNKQGGLAPVSQTSELMAYLLQEIPGKGRNRIKSMLARGQIQVNRQTQTQYNHPLQPGDVVTVLKHVANPLDKPLGMNILFEDSDLIVIDKEAGLLSIASEKEKEQTAYHRLVEYVRKQGEKERIFIIHRLDRDTSGVMVFARSQRVQKLMQSNWNERVRNRQYLALVEGHPQQDSGRLQAWLKENKSLRMYDTRTPGDGQHAISNYQVLGRGQACSLLEVSLETGRKNQIRVQMQDLGHSVVGDEKYGAKGEVRIGRLGLHAHTLEFEHPSGGRIIRCQTPAPDIFYRLGGAKRPEA